MSEKGMEAAVQQALAREGIAGEVVAAGQFNPRGHSGSMVAGQMAGDELGGIAGAAGAAAGSIAGFAGGREANSELSGLPQYMLVGVTPDAVYGFAGASMSKEPGALVFQVPRQGLKAEVHQRVDVRVLELIDVSNGSRIELEGNRLPLTHTKDVIEELKSD